MNHGALQRRGRSSSRPWTPLLPPKGAGPLSTSLWEWAPELRLGQGLQRSPGAWARLQG